MKRFATRLVATQFARPLFNRFSKPAVNFRFCTFKSENYEFKTETKKLLDIVAKSLYTDKDVFLRELLSNASDALEKQRFYASQKDVDISADLNIRVELDENKRTITIEDTGVGMSKSEMIENLGTIARSGSKQFLEQNQNTIQDKIIGQFGVGFYSSFIVGDTVEVISKSEKADKTYIWTSDGTGTFQISEVTNEFLGRGTRIVIHLKPEAAEFCKKDQIIKTVQRYSNFIAFPITVNGEQLNLVQAIWSRNKSEVTGEEYNKFYEYISNSKMAYRYKLHYTTDAPLSIKALLYVPASHLEKFGMQLEEFDVHLYSKKILIKKNCKELLPNYFRFVKGAVDCEDLPLNISREHYQDTALIAKLKNIVTKRLIRELDAEATKDPATYLSWYAEFQNFLKEGIATDDEHKESLIKLLRFQTNKSEDYISLEQYVAKLPQGSNQIYFYLAPSRSQALNSPYLEPFQNQDVPVILIYNHLDEMVFKSIANYEKKAFTNVETEQHENDKLTQVVHDQNKGLPSDEVTPLCLWLKNELSPTVSQVQISKRLKNTPAIVTSALSSGMRQVMQVLGQGNEDMLKNLTLEINPNHDIIVNLNKIRKNNKHVAGLITKTLLDNCMLTAGLLKDPKGIVDRTNNLLSLVLSGEINTPQVEETQAYREQKGQKQQEDLLDTEIIIDDEGNPKVVTKKK